MCDDWIPSIVHEPINGYYLRLHQTKGKRRCAQQIEYLISTYVSVAQITINKLFIYCSLTIKLISFCLLVFKMVANSYWYLHFPACYFSKTSNPSIMLKASLKAERRRPCCAPERCRPSWYQESRSLTHSWVHQQQNFPRLKRWLRCPAGRAFFCTKLRKLRSHWRIICSNIIEENLLGALWIPHWV